MFDIDPSSTSNSWFVFFTTIVSFYVKYLSNFLVLGCFDNHVE